MVKNSHNIPIEEDNWKCLKIYCANKGDIFPTDVINECIDKFLKEKSSEIEGFISRQKRIVEKRVKK